MHVRPTTTVLSTGHPFDPIRAVAGNHRRTHALGSHGRKAHARAQCASYKCRPATAEAFSFSSAAGTRQPAQATREHRCWRERHERVSRRSGQQRCEPARHATFDGVQVAEGERATWRVRHAIPCVAAGVARGYICKREREGRGRWTAREGEDGGRKIEGRDSWHRGMRSRRRSNSWLLRREQV